MADKLTDEVNAVRSTELLAALAARRDAWYREADEHERDAEISAARRCTNRAIGIAEAMSIIQSKSNDEAERQARRDKPSTGEDA